MGLLGDDGIDNEVIALTDVKNLSSELIEENIKSQIAKPLEARLDCVETFDEQIEESLADPDLQDDEIKAIQLERARFYNKIIALIDDKYCLECDLETIASKSTDDLGDICHAMYHFFVLKRKKNIKNMMLNYILSNSEDICNALDYLRKKKDVTTIVAKKNIDDPDISVILANLQEVLGYIKSLDIDMADMIKQLDSELFDIAIITDMMNNCTMNCNYQARYFAPLWGYQDYNYDEILSKISHGIVKSQKKKKD